jgi:hypothetical protein
MLLGAVSILGACSPTDTHKEGKGKIVFSAKLEKAGNDDNPNYLLIETSLMNGTLDTLKFISMSCSWEDLYALDTEQLYIPGKACDGNYPIIKKIPPGTSEIKEIKVLPPVDFKSTNLEFRIGFNLVELKSHEEMRNLLLTYKRLTDGKNIIWSEALHAN